MKKIAYFVQFPIHYQIPLLQKLSKEVDLTVFYISDLTTKPFEDKGFGKIEWNVSLLDGYKYKILPKLKDNGKFTLFNPIVYGVKDAIMSDEWDAIWFHGYAHYALIQAFFMAKRRKIPIFYRMESNLVSTKKGFFKDLFIKNIVKSSKALLWVSSDNKEYYEKYGAKDKQLVFCPYAVDNDFFQQKAKDFLPDVENEKKRIGLNEDSKVILYAGKFQKRKNPFDLLQAFERISGKLENTYLVYVGTGEEEERLKSYTKKNGLTELVKFLGFKNQDILPLYYQMADIYVLPSNKEPFGMVVPEILNLAKPVITTTEVGSARDLIVDGENGYVIEPNDIDTLSSRILKLLENEGLRKKFGDNGLQIVNRWSYREDIDGILKALEL
jgi:glycosyltransferase involved in cell wall biosynthesis